MQERILEMLDSILRVYFWNEKINMKFEKELNSRKHVFTLKRLTTKQEKNLLAERNGLISRFRYTLHLQLAGHHFLLRNY